MARIDRRTFIRGTAMGAGALWMLSLGQFRGRHAEGVSGSSPYGEVRPRRDETTGLELMQLPDGFRYMSFSWTGDVMADGTAAPPMHDGMAVVDVQGSTGRLVLVRNHEAGAGAPYIDKPSIAYANDGAGGTTNLVFDPRRGRWETAWSSLAGTIRNCAGGVTPWNTWISAEETMDPGHGWTFEINAQKGDPTPLVDMGRFRHEALMVDQGSGYVYETEDAGDAGFYRFVPNVPGDLKQGGELFMLKVRNKPNADLGLGYPIGRSWDVEWVPIADPSATTLATYVQGAALGGARFRRLEGCWWGDRKGYFVSTDGGVVREGQVFEYDPDAETIRLIYDSPGFTEVDNPDNLVVTPRGVLMLCEDNAGGRGAFGAGERLLGLTMGGQVFTFAVNNVVLPSAYNARVPAGDYRQNEWAGACYSPDGRWLFVNIHTPGITFAITGPWGAGPL